MKKFDYKISTQYIFIEYEFWKIHYWIRFSSYIFHAYKISKRININSYVINQTLGCGYMSI